MRKNGASVFNLVKPCKIAQFKPQICKFCMHFKIISFQQVMFSLQSLHACVYSYMCMKNFYSLALKLISIELIKLFRLKKS